MKPSADSPRPALCEKQHEADANGPYDTSHDLSDAEIEFLNTLIGLAVDEWHKANE